MEHCWAQTVRHTPQGHGQTAPVVGVHGRIAPAVAVHGQTVPAVARGSMVQEEARGPIEGLLGQTGAPPGSIDSKAGGSG